MEDSGNLSLDGDAVRYRSKFGDWELPVSSLRVLGENTNQNGPYADDWFLCFATGPEMWLEAPVSAEGSGELLKALSKRLGVSLATELFSSTDFTSRVLWPPELAGQPMFQFANAPAESWFAKLLGTHRVNQTYSEPVKLYLVANQA